MPVHTMTKLPSDSFWPTGVPDSEIYTPFPKLTTDSSSSIISPLTLPRGVAGYFDHVAFKGAAPTQLYPVAHPSLDGGAAHQPRGSRVYSPLSPGARGPALHPASFLSPHLLPSAKQAQLQFGQHRSSSVPPKARSHLTSPRAGANGSPTGREMAASPTINGRSPIVNGSMPPRSLASAAPRSISVDAASAPPHDQAIQRLVQQNARIREAWEAERKYLEANRERVEEVYKEERALMEEERAEWDAERAALIQEIGRLQQALGAGGGSPPPLNGMHSFSGTSFLSNLDQRGGGSQGTSRISPNSSLSSERASQPGTQSNGQATRNGNSSLPMAAPRIQDLTSPRSPNGPSVPTPDFLKPAEASESESEPVPIVDVNEIHPELEGIPIKATSVKKATFTDTGSPNGSKTSSLSSSPPAGSDQQQVSPRAKKEQTLQVLAAKETERLTMHAGHTPNHSLSSLATVASSGTATATSNGGDSTPTMPHEDGTSSQNTATAGEDGVLEPTHTADPLAGVTDRHGQLLRDHPEPMFEPGEDPELKGPLMVRNMPAHDEIFFQKLSDKLEEVCKDNSAALPAVLKDSEPAAKTNPARRSNTQADGQPGPQHDTAGSDAGSEDSKSTPKSGEEEGFDVPIKFKKRMNFGAPFGEFR